MLVWQKKRKLKALQKELEAFMLERQFRADVLRDYGNSAAYQFLIFKYQVERDICEDETLLPLYQEKIDFLRELAQAENKRLPFFEKPFYASAACYGSPWFPMGSKDMGGSSEDSETRQDAAHGPRAPKSVIPTEPPVPSDPQWEAKDVKDEIAEQDFRSWLDPKPPSLFDEALQQRREDGEKRREEAFKRERMPFCKAPSSEELDDFMSKVRKNAKKEGAETFPELVNRFMREKGLTPQKVYVNAKLSRQDFSRVTKRGNGVTRSTVYSVAVGLKLDWEETIRLLNSAGIAFDVNSDFDLVLMFCIRRRIYDIIMINLLLDYKNQRTLAVNR